MKKTLSRKINGSNFSTSAKFLFLIKSYQHYFYKKFSYNFCKVENMCDKLGLAIYGPIDKRKLKEMERDI